MSELTPKISVVIPVRNEGKKIEKCLEAVFSQNIRPYEVIIVDGASTDDTVRKARSFPPVRIVPNVKVLRPAGCQVGLEAATGEFIAFTDGDCIPDKKWLETLHKEMAEEVVGVGGVFKDIGEGLWMETVNETMRFNGARSRWDEKKEMKVLSVTGANGMVRREDALATGFNTELIGSEDLEFSKRLGKRGRLVYVPEAVVLHDHRRGFWGFIKRSFEYGRHRREAGMVDAQTLAAMTAPLEILAIPMYLVGILVTGAVVAIYKQSAVFALTVPVALAGQHTGFILGWWTETVREAVR